ncbi:hypothetical protein H8356DRAFT_1299095 [Neocallimastix lanati (nom. inval.)]|nr:hypothetical protein H8356DRAFT_1299095 [Neocallimastix sp. JGI-2020a]
MINCMKTTMNEQKQFAFVSKDAKLKGDEIEHEQSYKIKKDKYELLCEEVIKNIELLEAKGKADIPNYLQSMYDSMNILYHQTINYFPESDSYK